jgi:hypothetical protein
MAINILLHRRNEAVKIDFQRYSGIVEAGNGGYNPLIERPRCGFFEFHHSSLNLHTTRQGQAGISPGVSVIDSGPTDNMSTDNIPPTASEHNRHG